MNSKSFPNSGSLFRLDRRLFSLVPDASERPSVANYGGAFAVHPRQGFLISTEWGVPAQLQLGLDWDAAPGGEFSLPSSLSALEPA